MNDTIQNVNRTLESVLTALNLLVVQGLQNCNIVAGCGNDIRSCINQLAAVPDSPNMPEPETAPAEPAK